eukprot:1002725-Rhodomonas_salina.1
MVRRAHCRAHDRHSVDEDTAVLFVRRHVLKLNLSCRGGGLERNLVQREGLWRSPANLNDLFVDADLQLNARIAGIRASRSEEGDLVGAAFQEAGHDLGEGSTLAL